MSGSAGAQIRALPGMDSVIAVLGLVFVPFIIITSFAVLDPFIALIVNSVQSMQTETQESLRAEALAGHNEREVLSRQIEALSAEIRQIREALRKD